jgi:hypothetical protein
MMEAAKNKIVENTTVSPSEKHKDVKAEKDVKIAKAEPATVKVTVEHTKMSKDMEQRYMKKYNCKTPPQLTPCEITIELKHVPQEVANALRRTFSEMPGKCLIAPGDTLARQLGIEPVDQGSAGKGGGGSGGTASPPGGAASSPDPFIILAQICESIRLIPLRASALEKKLDKLRFELKKANNTAEVMTVYSRDLRETTGGPSERGASAVVTEAKTSKTNEILFNPTFVIGVLQPGRSIEITGIRIIQKSPKVNCAFQVGLRASLKYLDLEELPKEKTHAIGASHADLSGYVLPSSKSNPRHHRVTVTLPAVGPDPAEAKRVYRHACENIKERLQKAAATKIDVTPSAANETAKLVLADGETSTISRLIARAVFEIDPTVQYAHNQTELNLTETIVVTHKSGTADLIKKAIQKAYDLFDSFVS